MTGLGEWAGSSTHPPGVATDTGAAEAAEGGDGEPARGSGRRRGAVPPPPASRPPTSRRPRPRPETPLPLPTRPRGPVTRLRRRATPRPYRSVQLRRARPKPVPPLLFGSTAAWATHMLFPTYRREVLRAGFTWCPRWWAHAEAVGRLEALWRAWEHHRQLPAMGMATWWKDYADPTMTALFHPSGPFAACTPTRHHDRDPVPPLPQEPPPAALFPDIRVRPEPKMWRHRRGRR